MLWPILFRFPVFSEFVMFISLGLCHFNKWATTWQNQQNVCAPSEDSDPPSLIRVFPVSMKKAWVLSSPLSARRRLWSDWVDAQADLSLRWAHSHFVGFVMSRLKLLKSWQRNHTTWEKTGCIDYCRSCLEHSGTGLWSYILMRFPVKSWKPFFTSAVRSRCHTPRDL